MTVHSALPINHGNSVAMKLTCFSRKTSWNAQLVPSTSILSMWVEMQSYIGTNQLESK